MHLWFREQQAQQARKAAMSGSAMACRAVARLGVPASERPGVWAAALGMQTALNTTTDAELTPTELLPVQAASSTDGSNDTGGQYDARQLPSAEDLAAFQLLCESVEQQSLLTDVLACAEVQHIADNEQYFVFEEMVRCVLLLNTLQTDGPRGQPTAVN
jgi:hypothetical protein